MLQKNSIVFDYDKKFDVLYIALGDRSNSYGDDSDGNVIYLKDIDTDELTGITIMNFKKKYIENKLPAFSKSIRNVLHDAEKVVMQ
mgnify:FL=1|jgi:hypothetical protein|nr:MAG TPA: Protein of unknown function (DUF2283) [Bacteriophage sp.]DAW18918.1 MAG TPA: Protein of unknown function (DUF2283) [Bacteriophage sp.]